MVDINHKNLTKELIRIALPVIGGMAGMLIFELVDIFWIAKLGRDAIAGVASSGFLEWMVWSLMTVTLIGCQTLVSHSIGAKDLEKSHEVAKQAFKLSGLICLPLMVLLWFSAKFLFSSMGLNKEALTYGLAYYKMFVIGLPIFYSAGLCGQIFNAHGDTKTSVLILTAAIILNAILDPFFIFGWWIFPRWETFGASFATTLSWIVCFGGRFYFLRRKNYIGQLRTYCNLSSSYFKEILRIGWPAASSRLIWSLVYPLLITLITPFGMAPLAGLTIAHRLESIAFSSAIGFSTATATLVGQSVGRRDYEMIKKVVYHARQLMTVILFPMSLIFLFFPEILIRFATADPEIIRHGAEYLRIIGVFEIFLGWELIFEGGFNGIGNTKPYMYISLPLTLGRYPLAYVLVTYFDGGVSAIWWAISISTALKGLLLNFQFKRSQERLIPLPLEAK